MDTVSTSSYSRLLFVSLIQFDATYSRAILGSSWDPKYNKNNIIKTGMAQKLEQNKMANPAITKASYNI